MADDVEDFMSVSGRLIIQAVEVAGKPQLTADELAAIRKLTTMGQALLSALQTATRGAMITPGGPV